MITGSLRARSAISLAVSVLLSATSATARPQETGSRQDSPGRLAAALEQRALLDKYCVTCHNQRARVAGLALDALDVTHVSDGAAVWEKVIRKLGAGAMPPAGQPRPDAASYDGLRTWLETEIDRGAKASQNPGRTAAVHRLNRTQYRNAIRDLFALDVDVDAWLPGDPSSYGFDNIGDALGVSPGLLEQYLSVAQRVARLAVGNTVSQDVRTYVVPSDLTQRDHLEGLPFGTRGGTVVRHAFARDGEYVIQLRLGRNYNTRINGLAEPHQIEVTLDGERAALFAVGGETPDHANNLGGAVVQDDPLRVRLPVRAGTRTVGVAFLKHSSAQFEALRKPILRDRVEYGDTQGLPTLARVEIGGPYEAGGADASPTRRRIFACYPARVADEAGCARTILATLARRAYRRPVTAADLQVLLPLFAGARERGGFEQGIEAALTRMLVSPSFLFRIEQDPPAVAFGAPYPVDDLELASRMSFFLWNSIPDDELLAVAVKGRLANPAEYRRQVGRMLEDPKSEALVSDFAGQWLRLRNLPQLKSDRWMFPDFDENLRRAFRRETELFFDSILREDRSVLDLLSADYTFLNERLARHYGIPSVYGDQFRRVTLPDGSRGGLLGQGSVLALTSAPNRTSPVRRGVYILENMLGVAPPPPPANVPPLEGDTSANARSMRERMVAHRANPVCASCHALMDPLGLALENFDAIGRWRASTESGTPLDVSGALPDGTKFDGAAGLKQALLRRPREFVTTVTEKLLTYALGRGLEYYDAPTVRSIERAAAERGYRFSALITGVMESAPFRMRKALDRSEGTTATAALAPR